MIIFKRIIDLQSHLQKVKKRGHSLGLVPTMGALHQGHISLLEKCKTSAEIAIASIFINPTQFNNKEDFEKYPVTIENDIALLEQWGCDILFMPSVDEMYPSKNVDKEIFDLGFLENILEGKYRPGHFQGVCMIVKHLLQIIQPDYLFVGQKDYQQCLVLKKLLLLMHSSTQLIICPTIRESDGLAMSSRNLRLREEDRKIAAEIFTTMNLMQEQIAPGNLQLQKDFGINRLTKNNFTVDYVQIANADNLAIIDNWDGKEPIVILVAAYLNGIRLIDNLKY